MRTIAIGPDELLRRLLSTEPANRIAILDSGGKAHSGSNKLITAIDPIETAELNDPNVQTTLDKLDTFLSGDDACIFTLSYDLGRRLNGFIGISTSSEPDVYVARFQNLIVHDYDSNETTITGNPNKFDSILDTLGSANSIGSPSIDPTARVLAENQTVTSNFSKHEYLAAIERIKELIRSGDTYQTNLTQQLTAILPLELTPGAVFANLRRVHGAPYAAFIRRNDSTVISASPELFFKVETEGRVTTGRESVNSRTITTSPIKGTRPRGKTKEEDEALKSELLTSEKDLAENTMIVDLLRNDLGRVCEYGSVEVEKLCDLEEHPTLFHLVSTVSGELNENTKPSDILRALFPCGSITGAPKISTMKIIDEIEPTPRGLSMGAIGYYLPSSFGLENSPLSTLHSRLDLSVAIRTMVIRGQTATFNVGGGIVIDSDPEAEYAETLTKAKALLEAIGGHLD